MASINILEVSANAKIQKIHYVVLFWCFLILVLDGYDLAVAGAALPAIMDSMGVTASTAGFMASSALFGMMFGAIGLGGLSDKIGRRKALALCVISFSVFTALSGLAKDPYTFSVLRFLAGIGIGGALPNSASHMTEYAPQKMRSLMTVLSCCGYAVGSLLAAVLGKQFILSHGWQMVFFLAGIPVILVPFIMLYLPESLSYLLKKQDHAQLRQIAKRLQPDLVIDDNTTFDTSVIKQEQSQGISGLFGNGLAFGTLMLWLSFITSLFMLYALSSWLVKLMALAGHSLGSALNFLLVYNFGAIIGAIVGGWLADKFSIKTVAVTMGLTAMISLVLLAYGVQPLFLVVGVVGASTLGSSIMLYAYSAQYYPAHLRSFGVGTASGMGRIGAISAPIVIGVLVGMNLPLEQNFFVIAGVALMMTIALALVNIKNHL